MFTQKYSLIRIIHTYLRRRTRVKTYAFCECGTVQNLTSFVCIFSLILESSRWLVCNHFFAEAEQTTKEMMACNCHTVPELTTLFDIARTCVQATMHKKKYTFIDLITSKKLRLGTLATVCTWQVWCCCFLCN